MNQHYIKLLEDIHFYNPNIAIPVFFSNNLNINKSLNNYIDSLILHNSILFEKFIYVKNNLQIKENTLSNLQNSYKILQHNNNNLIKSYKILENNNKILENNNKVLENNNKVLEQSNKSLTEFNKNLINKLSI